MSDTFTPGVTGFSRVFLIEGQARPDHEPTYQSCSKAGGVSQSFGDIERIQCPSTEQYGQFDEVGKVQGAVERATSSLMGLYAADLRSTLLKLAKQRCPVDAQIHFGKCTDPRVFNTFTKAVIWEDVNLTDYSTDDLGAVESGENSKITETSNLSIGNFYEVLQLTFQERALDTVVNELVDAVICDKITCGDCDDPSDGAQKAFVLQGGLTGSPGTPPDIIYTEDGGKNWASDEILSLTSGEAANALACLGDYLIVVSNASNSLHYKERTDVLAGTPGEWSEVATGFVTDGEPNDIWGVGISAFVVGDGGYVYYVTSPSSGVSVLDAGVATTNDLNAIHALSDEVAVAVGDSDTIIYTTNRYNWVSANATGGGGDLQCIWMWSRDIWWVGDSNGKLYYTLDQGQHWTEKFLPGASISSITDIQFSEKSVGYICGVANSLGAAWRTYDAGYDWVKLPEGVGSLPGSATQFNALAATINNPNFVIVAGQDTSDDGVLLVGED